MGQEHGGFKGGVSSELVIKFFFVSLSDLFYPPHCAGCQRALVEHQEHVVSSLKRLLCSDCCQQLQHLTPPYCPVCSYTLSSDVATCSNCAQRGLHFVAGVAALRYQGLTKELLARYKYGRDQSLKKLLQQLVVTALQDERLKETVFEAVVPVPLYPVRERERGFNQARVLAQEVASHYKLPLRSLLKRVALTSFQAASHRQQRLKNLEGAFALRRPLQLHGNYLLVDDVLTTGATLDECAKLLLQAGADAVWAVTLAR